MKKKLKTVELYPAWAWDCDYCGCQNYSRGITQEFGDEEEKKAAFREHYGLSQDEPLPGDWDEMEAVMYPQKVDCSECGRSFKAVPYCEPDEDDEYYPA